MLADRAQHVAEVIRPALERGAIVIVCDRFTPSSLAYQGVGARPRRRTRSSGVERRRGRRLEPDLVLVLDVPDDVAEAAAAVVPRPVRARGRRVPRASAAAYRELAAERGWVLSTGADRPTRSLARVWAAVEPIL